MDATPLPSPPEGFHLSPRQLISYFLLFIIFFLSASFCTLLSFFAYEEYCDLNRYSELAIRPPKDDYFQSLGNNDPTVTVESLIKILGKKGAKTFAYLDRDGNGLVSAAELEPVIHLVRSNRNHPFNAPFQSCSRQDCLRLVVDVEPLSVAPNCSLFIFDARLYTNLTRAFCSAPDSLANCSEDAKQGEAFLEHHFKAVRNDRSRLVDKSHFSAFLPPADVKVGDTYPIVDKIDEGPSPFSDSIVRFDPYIEPRHRALAAILNHFHDDGHVLLYPSKQPRCSFGVVRAKNDAYMDLHFWLHVEFAGNISGFVAVPGALQGRLVVRRRDNEVLQFRLSEASGRAGFFPNRFSDDLPHGEARLPRMEMQTLSNPLDISTIGWTEAISPREAELSLNKALFGKDFPTFLSLADLRSRRSGASSAPSDRPLLFFLTLGSLRDVSCRDACSLLRDFLSTPKVRVQLRYTLEAAAADWLELQASNEEEGWLKQLTLGFEEKLPEILLCVLTSDARTVLSRHDVMSEVENLAKTITEKEPAKEQEEEEEEERRKDEVFRTSFDHLIQRNADYRKRVTVLAAAFLQLLDGVLHKP